MVKTVSNSGRFETLWWLNELASWDSVIWEDGGHWKYCLCREGVAANGNGADEDAGESVGVTVDGMYPMAGAVLGAMNPERGDSGGANDVNAGLTNELENGQYPLAEK